jgi:ADP-heptose:LPS heptosyltransferase
VKAALLYCAGGGIGDSLVASVVARALRTRYQRVDALTLVAHRSTLERVPDVDTVLTDDGGSDDDLARRLRKQEYSCCVITWATPRAARVAQRARIPIRIGQGRRLYSHRFTTRVVVRSERGDVTSHWSDILLDYARAAGCDCSDRVPRFVPSERDASDADRLISRLRICKGEYLLLHPTNAIAPARDLWPTQGWSKLAGELGRVYDLPVLVSGTSADNAIVERIVRDARRQNNATVIGVAGTVGIGGFGALARSARAFVGITTGTMHVAAAAGAPTVGIFPFQTDFPERWAPLGARVALVRATYPCRAGDLKETCRDYACIANLAIARIVAAVESVTGPGPVGG